MKNNDELGTLCVSAKNKGPSKVMCTVKCALVASAVSVLAACGGNDDGYSTPVPPEPTATPTPTPAPAPVQFELVQGGDANSKSSALLSLNPGGPGGSPNQSLRSGDVLSGDENNNIIIGGLGVDVLLGYDGDDILIGGTEDFNSSVDGDGKGSDNRDRALGHGGNDLFIWTPGDGSDFFDGGEGIDVVMFGLIGESQDSDGNTEGAPFFGVNPPGSTGSQDFDGIHLDAYNQPSVSFSNSPGFCTVVDATENAEAFERLDIDNVVRFSIRGIANLFDAGEKTDDDGLRVAVTLKNTEFVVCTKRALDDTDTLANIEVIDISGPVPVQAELSDLPEYIQALVF